MVKYICYNWMPAIAQHAMDESAEFYRAAGAGTLHNHPTFDPYKVRDKSSNLILMTVLTYCQLQIPISLAKRKGYL